MAWAYRPLLNSKQARDERSGVVGDRSRMRSGHRWSQSKKERFPSRWRMKSPCRDWRSWWMENGMQGLLQAQRHRWLFTEETFGKSFDGKEFYRLGLHKLRSRAKARGSLTPSHYGVPASYAWGLQNSQMDSNFLVIMCNYFKLDRRLVFDVTRLSVHCSGLFM